MKRLTKSKALYLVLEFGREEEHKLIEIGSKHDAYQIEHARRTLLYALQDSVKEMLRVLDAQITFTVDDNEVWHYDPCYFVADDMTRHLLYAFRKELKGE